MEGFSGSRIRGIYPDGTKVLALVEVSELLLDGIFQTDSLTRPSLEPTWPCGRAHRGTGSDEPLGSANAWPSESTE